MTILSFKPWVSMALPLKPEAVKQDVIAGLEIADLACLEEARGHLLEVYQVILNQFGSIRITIFISLFYVARKAKFTLEGKHELE